MGFCDSIGLGVIGERGLTFQVLERGHQHVALVLKVKICFSFLSYFISTTPLPTAPEISIQGPKYNQLLYSP